MTNTISNQDDLIDFRDIIARIKVLERQNDSDCLDAAEIEELAMLQALESEAQDYCENWAYGATLIRATYFTKYCQELLEDCGELPKNLPSYIEIDWEATAENLKVDYTEIEFDGITYLIR